MFVVLDLQLYIYVFFYSQVFNRKPLTTSRRSSCGCTFLHFHLFIFIFTLNTSTSPPSIKSSPFILWLDHHSVCVPTSSSNNGLILVLRIKTVKNHTSILGLFFFNYYFCGFFLHTSWFLFSFTTPTSAVVSWVFHSLILFLREQVPVCGSTVITWSPSQLHSCGKQSSGNTCNVILFSPSPSTGLD